MLVQSIQLSLQRSIRFRTSTSIYFQRTLFLHHYILGYIQ
jgi:hypothetical protein